MMKIDIIIPNFNGAHLVEKNIQNVIDSVKGYDSEVIVVDDSSKDSDKERLRKIIAGLVLTNKAIRLIERKDNGGFSSAVNTGVKNSKADIVVLLNSDVSPHQDFIKSPLGKFQDNEDLFGVGCLDISHEEEALVKRGAGTARWESGMIQHHEGNLNLNKTFWISGGSSFFRRDIYMKLGGMDEIYNPFYWEDIDLSYRAQKAGYQILFDINSVVDHLHEEGAIKTNFKKNKIIATAYRNQFIFMWKNISDGNLILNHLLFLPLNIIRAIKDGNTQLVKGFILALIKLPVIIEKRFSQKKFYKVKDSEILNKFR